MKPNKFFKGFQNTQNQQLFQSGFFFQIPGTGGSLVLRFFKYPEPAGVTKIQIPAPHWFFGSDTCNAVNSLWLSHQTHSKCTPLSACSICTWMELLASVTQHPTNKPPLFFRFETIHLDKSKFLKPWHTSRTLSYGEVSWGKRTQ